MKASYWWKLASDESYLMMKVKIVREVKRSDGLWRFACGDVFLQALGGKFEHHFGPQRMALYHCSNYTRMWENGRLNGSSTKTRYHAGFIQACHGFQSTMMVIMIVEASPLASSGHQPPPLWLEESIKDNRSWSQNPALSALSFVILILVIIVNC